ncbi:fumarylacetoacetate hydrolase [Paenibacillus selenitireducens]|uniref:Fumarylacetoacetate hydrolase n=1 Tax=Paenibacillus selenitireducens TaxID=1324314 RepID=A0A1T2XMZ0_9BACL|nr:fumarylacetoacetate hydrolase family protein [Paenibacillus selenitireducens]OPA81106.1 fumarylacetoacetate hydrolase [Paenibacillus selenitireducens]
MNSKIRNVYCVGRNYRLHAAEMGNEVPKEPMIFLKPTHAVVAMNGGGIALPHDQGEVHYEAELVIRVGRDYTPGIHVDELIDVMSLGLDFTLRDVQSVCKQKGQPWTPAKGFKNSAPMTPYVAFPGAAALAEQDFSLRKNDVEVQRGNVTEMIFDLQTIVDYIAEHYGLGEGDLIFTGTPAGVGRVEQGDRFELVLAEQRLDYCVID